jgi:enoyl-CoA hydratase
MTGFFALPMPVVAAINGHAIAGGCVLALMCDERIMEEGNYKIGLNEVQLGIGLPSVVIESLRLAVPAESLVPLAVEGRLVSPTEALALGLVRAVVAPEELMDRAQKRAQELAQAPSPGVAQVKRALRRPALDAIARYGADETEKWLDTWFSPPARERLAQAVAKLR